MRQLQKVQVLLGGARHPGRLPVLKWLPIERLIVDDRYQRDIGSGGRAAIQKIAARFSWGKFSPVIVHEIEGGKYAIIDGQHRCTAALSIGIQEVPCSIVSLSNAAQAAEVFAAVNGDVIRMNALALFRASRAAGVQWAVDIQAACDAVGVTPLTHPTPAQQQKPCSTNAIGRLRRIVANHGRAGLEAVLRLVMAHPHARVPGYINSTAIVEAFSSLAAEATFRSAPIAAAEALIAGRQISRGPQSKIEPLPAAPVSKALVVVTADKRREAFDRIQELKARGCNRSMVAAITKFRMSLINELWEGYADAKA